MKHCFSKDTARVVVFEFATIINRNLQHLHVTNVVQVFCLLVFVLSTHTINLPLVLPRTVSNYVNLFFPRTLSSFLCSFQAHCLLALCLSKHTVYLPLLSKHTLYFPPFFPSLLSTYIYSSQPLRLTNQCIAKFHASDELVEKNSNYHGVEAI